MRDFHNLYVKNILIQKTSIPGNTLIDYACGKGGDLPKWINANLQFVLGIDLSKDNIENRFDGACARFLNYFKKYKEMPKALFVNGNSSINIKSGDALFTDKNKQIIKAIFGEGTKNELTLGKGVYNNYGIANNGFNISSIQFAIHYMFENELIFKEFINNVAECTALNGYFIGTCYDGKKVFKKLSSIEINNSISLIKNDVKIWEVTKKYSFDEYNDEDCFGYGIDVYQESINKTFREYLVNFDYLTRVLENYGFVLLTKDELKTIGLSSSVGSFNVLFNLMEEDINRDKRFVNKIGQALDMSNEEKELSFLNNYFIFKKVRNVTSETISKTKEKNENISQMKEKIKELDDTIKSSEKKDIESTSKKLAEKYIKEKEEKEQKEQKEEEKKEKQLKIKLSIDEKLKNLESKKKEKSKKEPKEKSKKEKSKK